MKVYELKIKINELYNESVITSKTNASFAAKLVEFTGSLNDEESITQEMMATIKDIFHQFWKWAADHLSYDQWKDDSQVGPWIALENFLAKAGVLPADYHHPILYESLLNHFNELAGDHLKANELIPLIITASRMLGYKEQAEEGYPWLRLNQFIVDQKPQELPKIKDIMFLLRGAFYLMYRFCTVEQLALLPFLIYFRHPTTDEERRSELAIFNWLDQKPAHCVDFFNRYDEYIDCRSITFVNALKNIVDCIPTKRSDFLIATNRSRWIYPFVQKARVEHVREDILDKTVHLLEVDFATRKDQSVGGVLNFIDGIKRQAKTLTCQEARIVHSAASLLCLNTYIQNRKQDKRDKYSFLSISGETKCAAAEKKQSAVRGKPNPLSFFETIAINQGRLKKLNQFIEEDSIMNSKENKSIMN
ncbi:Uncharacterised protein [Legionella wadsworthii]|uniref:Uncharacterized protein n=1 Tax=Legionella wadsworthii TaxID=28088 RepID=A0A378LQL1_9GAMM|nr:hypothetical protein [Legionella wadsworthii]STY28640.1 Uncharacterised protein [Legionella wadsworthii]